MEKLFSIVSKKTIFNWRSIGFLPIIFGIVYYIFNIINHAEPWFFLWVCPATAIIAGFFILFQNRFGMSAAIVWISSGPLLAVLFETKKTLQPWQIYHLFSVIALLAILYHLKETWNTKGFLFGSASFYSYILFTSYLSKGKINILGEWWTPDKTMLWLGIFFAVLSAAIFLWNIFERKEKNKL
jgi:hypothetical protein